MLLVIKIWVIGKRRWDNKRQLHSMQFIRKNKWHPSKRMSWPSAVRTLFFLFYMSNKHNQSKRVCFDRKFSPVFHIQGISQLPDSTHTKGQNITYVPVLVCYHGQWAIFSDISKQLINNCKAFWMQWCSKNPGN